MRNYPTFEVPESSRDYQQEFDGYNHNIRISDYEFYDEKNMTGDYYPVFSPRNKRGHISTDDIIPTPSYTQGDIIIKQIANKDKLCVLYDDEEYVGDVQKKYKLAIDGELITAFNDGAGTYYYPSGGATTGPAYYDLLMINSGAYLIIFKKLLKENDSYFTNAWYINTKNYSEYGYINNINSSQATVTNEISFIPCTREGGAFTFPATDARRSESDYPSSDDLLNIYVQPTAPTTEAYEDHGMSYKALCDGAKWLDTSDAIHHLKSWDKQSKMWSTINTTFIKIQANGIGENLKEGDAVEISLSNNWEIESFDPNTVFEKCKEQIKTILTNMIVVGCGENYIVVSGFLEYACSISSQSRIHITRLMPYMDYVYEANNHIWGCRYGVNRNGDYVNEIYSSKQGDFKNWTVYQGISTDSYAATVGSDGPFTGCIAFQNAVLFFKENCVHKVLGTYPPYQIQEIKMRGVQKGSEKSLCVVNETLFYKTTNDICYYTGSLPVSISEPLGETRYKNAVFGSIKSKLYANMQDYGGAWHLFTYDADKGIWHKEDNIHVKDMCRVDDDLYFIDIDNNIGSFNGSGTAESDFEWYAETGPIGYSMADNKYIGRMTIRISKPLDSKFRLLICYDEEEEWLKVAELYAENGLKSFSLPVIPHRCDYFRLRFEGIGPCKIFSLCKTIESGSDEYVY